MNESFIALRSAPSVPPWVKAVDAQSATLKNLGRIIRDQTLWSQSDGLERLTVLRDRLISARADYSEVIQHGKLPSEILSTLMMNERILQGAETYSFSGDALRAILSAAPSIPEDSVLQPDQIPGNAMGWFYFEPPLDIGDPKGPIHALSWGIAGGVDESEDHLLVSRTQQTVFPAGTDINTIFKNSGFFLAMTAFTEDKPGQLFPATIWHWGIGETIKEVRTGTYGEAKITPENISVQRQPEFKEQSSDLTLFLCRFFLAASVWMDQEIIETTEGTIERHHRKRIAKERKGNSPRIRVVSLRKKRHNESSEPSEPGEPPKWSFRWVVGGHWRNQPYGPNRELRKLIYIMPFVKGPQDAPLREPRKKVFAVVR